MAQQEAREALGTLNPIEAFDRWLSEATADQKTDVPNALTLCTVQPGGKPSARVVLLKGVKDGAFQFFTNYESRKAREIETNSAGAMVFHWDWKAREVRVEGKIEKLSTEESEEYFATRPRESQIGAWASVQSAPLHGGKGELLARYREYDELFLGKPVPRPPHWGGYRLVPEHIEFWIGQPGRLHDRFLFTRDNMKGPAATWSVVRLSP